MRDSPQSENPQPNPPALIPPARSTDGPWREKPTRKFPGRWGFGSIVLLCVLIGGGLLVYAQTKTAPQPALPAGHQITIKIGADLPLSGGNENAGKAAANGMLMAIDEANAANFLPGYKFVLDTHDDISLPGMHGGGPDTGVQNIVEMINDARVAGILGPIYSSLAQSEMPVANQAPIALISPASTRPCLTQNSAESGCVGANDLLPILRPTGRVTYFRLTPVDTWQGVLAAEFSFSSRGHHTAFVMDDMTPYSTSLAHSFIQEFLKDGGHVLGHDSLSPIATSSSGGSQPVTDYTQELTKIAILHPDMIYFSGLDRPEGITLYKQMASITGLLHTPFVSDDGIITRTFAEAVGVPHSPVYSTVSLVDVTKLPSMANFVNRYQAAYGPIVVNNADLSEGGIYSAYSYDSARILLNAIKRAVYAGFRVPTYAGDLNTARIFRQAVIDALAKTDYNGVLGHQSFDANGDTTNHTLSLYQFTSMGSTPAWTYLTTQAVPAPPGWKYDPVVTSR